MQAKIAVLLVRVLATYLERHPDVVDAALDELAKVIPGTTDDVAIKLLEKVLKAL